MASLSEIEGRLRELYAELLEVGDIPSSANFIAYGGDSLRATILANTVEEEIGVRPPLVRIFDSTLAELAAECVRRRGEPTDRGDR